MASPVLIRGFGLAFVDLMVRLAEERGGRFHRDHDGVLAYRPNGAEPAIFVGSRRGVPYHAKLGYVNLGAPPLATRYLTFAALEEAAGAAGRLDYHRQIWPLLVRELTFAHYRELFVEHPERTTLDWDTFADHLDRSDVESKEFNSWAAQFVPDPVDRFDIELVDRPLRGERFIGEADLTERLRQHIAADLRRRADPAYSSDLAVFNALLASYGAVLRAVSAGLISPADRISRIEGHLHSLFSFVASGPPPRRLEELLALNAAGVVRFLGPDLEVRIIDGAFVASSPAVGGATRARVLIEGRLPSPDVVHAVDPVIRSLLANRELAVEAISDPAADTEIVEQAEGFALVGGHLLADARSRAKRADGTFHDRRFLLGPSVSGSQGSAGFSRPHYNSPFLRQNDEVSRQLLQLVTEVSDALPAAALLSQRRPAPSRNAARSGRVALRRLRRTWVRSARSDRASQLAQDRLIAAATRIALQ